MVDKLLLPATKDKWLVSSLYGGPFPCMKAVRKIDWRRSHDGKAIATLSLPGFCLAGRDHTGCRYPS